MTVRERIADMLYREPKTLVMRGDIMSITGTTQRALNVHMHHLRKTWPHGGEIQTVRQCPRPDVYGYKPAGYRWVPA